MTQTRIHRFDFNSLRDFRGPIVMKAANEQLVVDLPPPPPPPVFHEGDLEAARLEGKKQGYADGFLAGQHEAFQQADAKLRHAHEVISQMADTVKTMQGRYLELLSGESEQLSQLVRSIAQKVIGSQLQSSDVAAIQQVVTQCLPVIFNKPKLVVELNPDMFEFTINYIEEQLRNAGFEGEIQFKGNLALGVSDVILDWGNGHMQRSADALWAEVETLIARMPLAITLALPPEPTESEQLTGE